MDNEPIDVNVPVTNPNLVAAIAALRSNYTPATNAAFMQELKSAHFLSPVTMSPLPEPDENGIATTQTKTKISFFMLDTSGNETFWPLFTDWPELKKWRDVKDEQTIILSFDEIASMVLKESDKSNGIIIDPYGSHLALTKEMIENLYLSSDKLMVQTMEAKTQITIGIPANYPHELANAISCYLKTQKNINSAYLLFMHKDDEFSYLIVIDFTGSKKEIFDGIASIAAPLLKKGELLDMMSLEQGKNLVENYKPFYKRKRFGLF